MPEWSATYGLIPVLLMQMRAWSKPFDARVHLLASGLSLRVEDRAFASAGTWPAMSEAVLDRVEWRRRELNPRPEITRMAASTCIVDGLISVPSAGIDTLRWGPAVCVSPADQRPNRQASPHFASDASRATHRDEVALIRQPYEPGRQSQPGLQHHCWQLMCARRLTRPTSVLGMPPPPSPSGRNRSPPVVSLSIRDDGPFLLPRRHRLF